jgi:hypothetical protein
MTALMIDCAESISSFAAKVEAVRKTIAKSEKQEIKSEK